MDVQEVQFIMHGIILEHLEFRITHVLNILLIMVNMMINYIMELVHINVNQILLFHGIIGC